MPTFWSPQIETAEWIDRDLAFDAVTDVGTVRYVVRGECLKDIVQRTSAEALLHNLWHLREPLKSLARDALADEVIQYDCP